MLPASVRRRALATRMVQPGLLSVPPSGDPLRPVSEARVLVRLASVTGWRAAGLEALAPAELGGVPMESRLRATLPPWSTNDGVTFRLERLGGGGGNTATGAPRTRSDGPQRRRAWSNCRRTPSGVGRMAPQREDCSAAAAGPGSSSPPVKRRRKRSLLAWRGLDPAAGVRPSRNPDPGRDCSPCSQPDSGRRVGQRDSFAPSWEAVYRRASPLTTETLQSTSTSCEPATGGGQNHTYTATNDGPHQPVPNAARDCPASRCIVCREEANSPGHILLQCPGLAGTRLRLRLLGTIHPPLEVIGDADVFSLHLPHGAGEGPFGAIALLSRA